MRSTGPRRSGHMQAIMALIRGDHFGLVDDDLGLLVRCDIDQPAFINGCSFAIGLGRLHGVQYGAGFPDVVFGWSKYLIGQANLVGWIAHFPTIPKVAERLACAMNPASSEKSPNGPSTGKIPCMRQAATIAD